MVCWGSCLTPTYTFHRARSRVLLGSWRCLCREAHGYWLVACLVELFCSVQLYCTLHFWLVAAWFILLLQIYVRHLRRTRSARKVSTSSMSGRMTIAMERRLVSVLQRMMVSWGWMNCSPISVADCHLPRSISRLPFESIRTPLTAVNVASNA